MGQSPLSPPHENRSISGSSQGETCVGRSNGSRLWDCSRGNKPKVMTQRLKHAQMRNKTHVPPENGGLKMPNFCRTRNRQPLPYSVSAGVSTSATAVAFVGSKSTVSMRATCPSLRGYKESKTTAVHLRTCAPAQPRTISPAQRCHVSGTPQGGSLLEGTVAHSTPQYGAGLLLGREEWLLHQGRKGSSNERPSLSRSLPRQTIQAKSVK